MAPFQIPWGPMGTTSDSAERYSSRLATKADRFVSGLFTRTLENGWRDATDFMDHFSLERIVESLAGDEELRVKLLVETTGTHEKIAAKKSPASAAEDLRLALDEGTTTPDVILNLFDADDWVRLLGNKELWEFIVEDKFWNAEVADKPAFTEALERVGETIHCAIHHGLLTETAAVEAIGFERLVQGLEEAQLRELVVFALEAGKRNETFTAESLLDLISLEGIIENVSPARAWSEIVVQHVQQPLELGASGTAPKRSSKPPPASAEVERKPRAEAKAARSSKRMERPARAVTRSQSGDAPAESVRKSRPPPPAELTDLDLEARNALPQKQLTAPDAGRRRSSQPVARGVSSVPPPPPPPPTPPPPPPLPEMTSQRPVPMTRPQSLPPPPPSARAAAARSAPSVPPAAPPPANDPMLTQAVARLGRIDRLPARHAEFPGAVLHAIEAMYGELATVSDAQEQLNVIRDAFPNDLWRARAMLALLELLNPAAFAASPSIAHESADALSIRLLTEERQLSRNAAQARHGQVNAAR
jgi:hypothetical protein